MVHEWATYWCFCLTKGGFEVDDWVPSAGWGKDLNLDKERDKVHGGH